jgi:hypothetical protein
MRAHLLITLLKSRAMKDGLSVVCLYGKQNDVSDWGGEILTLAPHQCHLLTRKPFKIAVFF